MVAKECAVCGGRFTAKRDTAKYCSGRCRQRAHSAKDAPPPPPMRREGAAVVALPPRAPADVGLLRVTTAELEAAGRLETPLGQATILLATLLDSGVQDTGSSIAALVREFKATIKDALDGSQRVETPAERARRERAARVA